MTARMLHALRALHLPGAGDRPVSKDALLSRRRVYILPTRYGLAYAGVILVMLVGSVNYSNSLGHLLTFLLASLGLVSMLHTHRNLVNLSVRVGHASAVFPGEQALFRLCLHNPQPITRHAIEVTYRERLRGRKNSGRRCVHSRVLPDDVEWVELALTAGQRGWLRLGAVSLSTRYPLGLFRAWAPLRLDATCLVYPTPAGDRPLPPSEGHHPQNGRARGEAREDFAGFRDYLPGDSPKRVYWKAAARGQGLMVKRFAGDSAAQVVITWGSAGPGDSETRLSLLCRWVLDAHERGLDFGLEMPGVSFPIDRGERHLRRCLHALGVYGEAGD